MSTPAATGPTSVVPNHIGAPAVSKRCAGTDPIAFEGGAISGPSSLTSPVFIPESSAVPNYVVPGGTGSDVTVVMATLNERENLPKILSEIELTCGSTEVIVVDDGSSDGTREYLGELSQSNSRIRCVLNDQPGTIARAHAQGLSMVRTPYVILMDADLQHPPSVMPRMLHELKRGFDVVVASRYSPGGDAGPRDPIRGLISRVACAIARFSLTNARGLTDPVSGFFGVRTELVPAFDEPPKGYESLLFVLASLENPRVKEVPYGFRERGGGESKVVRGLTFVRVYLSGVILARRLQKRTSRTGVAAPRMDSLERERGPGRSLVPHVE